MISGWKSTVRASAAALLLGSLALASPAFAEGPGQYSVDGIDSRSKQKYRGTASLSQTGDFTWRIVWRIGGQSWNGYGVGDGKVIAVNYTGNGDTGVILLVTESNGTYKSIWANSGDKDIGTEIWTKK